MNAWSKRKTILREHGWTYSPQYQSWDSPTGGTDFSCDIRDMSDEDFDHMVDINDFDIAH